MMTVTAENTGIILAERRLAAFFADVAERLLPSGRSETTFKGFKPLSEFSETVFKGFKPLSEFSETVFKGFKPLSEFSETVFKGFKPLSERSDTILTYLLIHKMLSV
ncbi:MAG: hypothetical protein LBR08_08145 [Bacteroidales bacterium]|nr:hypothetical protein [Bacteroidales bacterium]